MADSGRQLSWFLLTGHQGKQGIFVVPQNRNGSMSLVSKEGVQVGLGIPMMREDTFEELASRYVQPYFFRHPLTFLGG